MKVSGVRDLFIQKRSSLYDLAISLFIRVEQQVPLKVVIKCDNIFFPVLHL